MKSNFTVALLLAQNLFFLALARQWYHEDVFPFLPRPWESIASDSPRMNEAKPGVNYSLPNVTLDDEMSLFDYDVEDFDSNQVFEEAFDINRTGFWAVFDHLETQQAPSKSKRPPSCILARMQVSLQLPDGLKMDLSNFTEPTSNRTIWFPIEALATNETCGTTEQSLVLIWNQTFNRHIVNRINLTLSFNQQIKNNTLTNGLSYVSIEIFHNSFKNSDDFVITASKQVELMQAPALFAYCCKESIQVPLDGKITSFGDENLDKERFSILPLTLTFDNLCIEVFRESRFYEELTHLKFSCKNGWPYKFVPEAVLTTLVIFSLAVLLAFIYKYQRRKSEMAMALQEEDTEPLVNK